MWTSHYDTFNEFRGHLCRSPLLVPITGRLAGLNQTVSLETALDETQELWVRGQSGWIAIVRREGPKLVASQLRSVPKRQIKWEDTRVAKALQKIRSGKH